MIPEDLDEKIELLKSQVILQMISNFSIQKDTYVHIKAQVDKNWTHFQFASIRV